MKETIKIAIDGPSGSGKSTLAKALSKKLGFVYIDTGALYRAVGLFAMQNGIPSETPELVVPLLSKCDLEMRMENGGNTVYLHGSPLGEELRTSDASRYASQVSKIPEVRKYLLETQRMIAKKENVIMDGRDIGTVILPDAQVKIFMVASPEARAKRRYLEFTEKGEKITFDQVLEDIRWRDQNDSGRDVAPLVPAADAIHLDNTELTFDETVAKAMEIIRSKIS